jgi:hypothetical protein
VAPQSGGTQLTDEQRALLKRYLVADNDFIRAQEEMKRAKALRDELQDMVKSIIKPINAPVAQDNAVFRVKQKPVKETLTKSTWVRKLEESGELRDPSKAAELVNQIYKSLAITKYTEELVRK